MEPTRLVLTRQNKIEKKEKEVKSLIIVISAVALLLLLALPAGAASNLNNKVETLWFDTYADVDRNPDPASIPPPTYFTQDALAAGQRYMVTISGTFSVWFPSDWTHPLGVTGSPEPLPMYPSETTINGQVGWDAEYAFAYPNDTGINWSLPFHQTAIRMSLDGGATWSHFEPQNSAYNRAHSYRYIIVGQGEPLGFWLDDGNFRDNYGMLKCEIRELGNNKNK